MTEKAIESWLLDDWNRVLFQHYFAEHGESTPVTRLVVTGEQLSKAGEGIATPDEARNAFVGAFRKSLGHRSLGSDAQRRAVLWDPTEDLSPPFVVHLLFTCMVVGDMAEDLAPVGDFRRRLTVLLGWGTGHGLERLPDLWQVFSDWLKVQYEKQRLVRRLVLPTPPARLSIIGYPYCLAFPTRRDQERLRKVFRTEQLLGSEPPVTRVFRVLEDQLALFTPQFQETYEEFRNLYHVSPRAVSGATAFWSVVREVTLTSSAEAPSPRQPAKLQLALDVDVDGYSLTVMSSREFSIKHFLTISFPLGLNDYPFLVVGSEDQPIDAALLEQFHVRSAAVLPSIFRDPCSAIRDGILLFVADETGQMYLLTRELPEGGRVLGLVADNLRDRFKIALEKAACESECEWRRSQYSGWSEIEVANGAALSDVDFDADSVLSEIRCLQNVLRPSRIAILGGAKSGQSYVGVARFLPEVVIDGADAVTAHGVDSRESISLRRAGDAGTWRFSLDRPEQTMEGTYQLQALTGSALLDRRSVSFVSEVRSTEYVSPSNPDQWLGEAGFRETAPPSDWPTAPGDCFEDNEHEGRALVLGPVEYETGEPKPSEQSPIVDELISFLAARGCYQQGIPEFELVGLLRDHLGLDWNSAWYVLRAWVEIGAFECLSLRTWRVRKCFARKPCLVLYRTHDAYRIALFGLVPSPLRRTFEAASTSLNCPVTRKSGLSAWVPTLTLTEVVSTEQLRELQRRSGVERSFWLKDLSEITIPIGSVQGAQGAAPLNWDVYRVWDFNRQSFVQSENGPDNQSVALSWCRRSDRSDYFSISQKGSPVWWGWSKTWALLRAYDLVGTVPFNRIGSQSLESSAAHIHLPLPLARAVAITGPLLPGPLATNSEDLSYFYTFASQQSRRRAIQALWPNLTNLSRERDRLPVDLELLWRESTASRQNPLPMPVLLRDRLASDPLLTRFAALHSIPRSILPILLSLTSRKRQSKGISKDRYSHVSVQ
jgi:hypothetical protein